MEDNIETMTFTHRANGPANSFGYDALDRLTNVQYLSDNQDIEDFSAMDNLGNRTGTITQRDGVRNYTTDSLTNRYTAINSPTQNLFYDLAGNLIEDHDGYRYVYDYENRIIRIYKLNGQTEIDVAFYAYDALGRRIGKYDAIASEMAIYYYNDQWQVAAVYDRPDVAGVCMRWFVFGNYIDEVLLMNDGTDDYYYLHDHLYSPVALLDDTGAVVERYEYDAYGEVQVLSSEFLVLSSSQNGNPYAFTGRELDTLDAETGLYDYCFRMYSPALSRFCQTDPLGTIDGIFRNTAKKRLERKMTRHNNSLN